MPPTSQYSSSSEIFRGDLDTVPLETLPLYGMGLAFVKSRGKRIGHAGIALCHAALQLS